MNDDICRRNFTGLSHSDLLREIADYIDDKALDGLVVDLTHYCSDAGGILFSLYWEPSDSDGA